MSTEHPDFCFPVCVLIDYRGFRLIAVAVLPISGKKTLVCGRFDPFHTLNQFKSILSFICSISPDGGATVTANDAAALNMMKECAKALNLSSHYVVEQSTSTPQFNVYS